MRKIVMLTMLCMVSLSALDDMLKKQGYQRIAQGKSAEGKGLMMMYAGKDGAWMELVVTPKVSCVVDSGTQFMPIPVSGEGT